MEIVDLSEENVSDYTDYLTPDMAENIGRIFYRGLLVVDDEEVRAGLVWEYKNMLNGKNKESRIRFFKAEDEEVGSLILSSYEERLRDAEIAKDTFSLPAKTSKPEKQMLKEAGFSVGLFEGDEIVARLSEIADIDFVKRIHPTDRIKPLKNATQRGLNAAIRRMMKLGRYGLAEDVSYLPRVYFENDISMYCEEDGIINGLFLCHKSPSGRITVILMTAIGNDYLKLLPHMIVCSVRAALENYPPETEIVIDRHNYSSLALGEKLFPSGFGIPIYKGTRELGAVKE